MAAVICSRRAIAAAEYLPVLLGTPAEGEAPDAESGSLASAAQRERFLVLWNQRWNEVVTALDAEVNSLEDDHCYHFEVIDIRGDVAEMSPEEKAAPGRNDLCPCGSGRKYKKCHGSGASPRS